MRKGENKFEEKSRRELFSIVFHVINLITPVVRSTNQQLFT